MVQYLMTNMLASPLQSIRNASFGMTSAFDGIRKDTMALAPDPVTLTKVCASCHGGIDRMAAAANLLNYAGNVFDGTTLPPKLAAREKIYAASPGWVESMNSPAINSWTINFQTSPYGTFQWGATTGTGLNALAVSAAATTEFRINLINAIWTLACGQTVPSQDLPVVISLANQMATTYQDHVTPMVQQVSTHTDCLGR
jgi:hypothetical protein